VSTAVMRITRQSYLYRERTQINGDDFVTNFIVRKTPFEITLVVGGSACGPQKLQCALLYHKTNKPVDSNSGEPIEYVCQPHEDGTNTCSVSFRINVLSTQHSNSLFVIKFTFGNQTVLSEPIRSVSKPEQIRKKLAQCEQGSEAPSNDEKTTKKRARAEELLETLAVIQQSQLQQTSLISSLILRGNVNQTPKSFEENLGSLISSFQSEDVEERPKKLGRFINSLDDDKKRALVSLGIFFLNLAPLETTSPKAVGNGPYLPFSPLEELNILGENTSGGFTSAEASFPESYLNWC